MNQIYPFQVEATITSVNCILSGTEGEMVNRFDFLAGFAHPFIVWRVDITLIKNSNENRLYF